MRSRQAPPFRTLLVFERAAGIGGGCCLAGGPNDRRVEIDRQRAAEQLDEDLDPLGGVQVALEDGVHHPKGAALDHDALSLI